MQGSHIPVRSVRGAKARMTIENAGGGRLRIATFDNVVVGGPEVLTSDAGLGTAGAGSLVATR